MFEEALRAFSTIEQAATEKRQEKPERVLNSDDQIYIIPTGVGGILGFEFGTLPPCSLHIGTVARLVLGLLHAAADAAAC